MSSAELLQEALLAALPGCRWGRGGRRAGAKSGGRKVEGGGQRNRACRMSGVQVHIRSTLVHRFTLVVDDFADMLGDLDDRLLELDDMQEGEQGPSFRQPACLP